MLLITRRKTKLQTLKNSEKNFICMRSAMRPELGEEKYAFVGVCELWLLRKDKTLHVSGQNFASGVGMSRDRLREYAP